MRNSGQKHLGIISCGEAHFKLKSDHHVKDALAPTHDDSKTNVAFLGRQVQNDPMSKDQESLIAADGLRYKTKEGGSPFKDSANMSSISCYKCGLHKPRALGIFRQMINQRMFLCGDCMPAKSE
jgi:hypothetical protein